MTTPVTQAFKFEVFVDEFEIVGDYSIEWWSLTKQQLRCGEYGYTGEILEVSTKASAKSFKDQFNIVEVNSTENGDRWWFKLEGPGTPDLYGMYEFCNPTGPLIRVIRPTPWSEWPELS